MKPMLAVATLLVATVALFTTDARQARAPEAAKSKVSTREQTKSAVAKRKIPCKTWGNAATCYRTHGRLWYQSWNFTWLFWKIGTHHLFKICDEPTFLFMQGTDDCFDPDFPTNLKGIYLTDEQRWRSEGGTGEYYPPDVFGDFEICPLEPERTGERQYACIESVKVTFVGK